MRKQVEREHELVSDVLRVAYLLEGKRSLHVESRRVVSHEGDLFLEFRVDGLPGRG